MNTLEQKNIKTVAGFIHDSNNEMSITATNQFFSSQIMEAFTDRTYELEEVFVEGEKVIARIIITAKHSGHFVGHAPTGKIVKLTQYCEFQVSSGEIVKHNGWYDTGTLLPQLQG